MLRRLEPFVDCADLPNELTFVGLILDTETTGVDHTRNEATEWFTERMNKVAKAGETSSSSKSLKASIG